MPPWPKARRLRVLSIRRIADGAAKREIAIARAEQSLAAARQDYAQDRLSETILSAPHKGLAIYSDPADWAGRPVTTGETIIQIADPSRVLLPYEAFGHLEVSPDTPLPRIGTRGVAKLYGETAPLGYWLLRRPLTIARQFFGI